MELSDFDIEYHPRISIKGQVLVDFIVELSDVQSRAQGDTLWVLETEGPSRVVEGGADIVLQPSKGLSVAQAVKFSFLASNNEAKYEAVLLRLRLAKELSITNLEL